MIGAIAGAALGGAASMYLNKRANEQNYNMAKEFAQNGIRWRVEDAKRAGIHPLAALGMSGAAGAPTFVGDTGMPNALVSMGQSISKKMQDQLTPEEKELNILNLRMAKSKLAEQDMRNVLLGQEVLEMQKKATAPGVGLTEIQPDQKISPNPIDQTRTAGDKHPGWKQYHMFEGWPPIDLLYSQEGPAESMEGMGALGLALIRNLIYNPYMKIQKSKFMKDYRLHADRMNERFFQKKKGR